MEKPRKLRSILLIILFSVSILKVNSQTAGRNLNLDIVFIGNSITQGVQLKNPQEEAPPATATQYIRTMKGIHSAEVLNRGRSGYTTVNFLPSPDGELSKVISATRSFHTDNTRLLVFSIMLGTNDSAEEGPRGAPLWPEQYRINIKAITDELLADFPGCKIIYQQPVWYSPTTYNRSRYLAAGLARLQTYFPELKNLVSAYSVSSPGQVLMGDTRAFDYFKDNYLTELIPENGNAGTFYLHPNKVGAVSLGKFWAEGIWQALEKQ